MRTLALDCNFGSVGVDDESYRETTSLLDYDLVIWQPSKTLFLYSTVRDRPLSNGYRLIDFVEGRKLREDRVRRVGECHELMKLGRALVIFTPAPLQFLIPKHGNSVLENVESNVLNFLPYTDCRTQLAAGSNFKLVGGQEFRLFWERSHNCFRYSAHFSSPVGEPWLVIDGTDKVVAQYIQPDNGHLIFLPELRINLQRQEAENLLQSIELLIEDLNKSDGEFSLPAWAHEVSLPGEDGERVRFKSLTDQKLAIENEIEAQGQLIQQLEKYKILFTADGKALEAQAKKIFEELGCKATEGAKGRDDLILDFQGRPAVVEVKGLTKSAAEKNAAQLEKWVSGYFDAHQVDPKGILLVNTFKESSLAERTLDSFPHQMLRFSEKREHCLITGLQLLGLYLDAKANPNKREILVESLFSTIGIYKGYEDWRLFLGEN